MRLTVQHFIDFDHAQQGAVCGADEIQMDFYRGAPPVRGVFLFGMSYRDSCTPVIV